MVSYLAWTFAAVPDAIAQSLPRAPTFARDGAPMLAPRPGTGEPGMWIDIDTARNALVCLQNAPSNAERFRLLESQLTLSTRELASIRVALTSAGNEVRIMRDQNQSALDAARDAQRERDVWWRSPWLWFVAGAVIATGVSLALVWSR